MPQDPLTSPSKQGAGVKCQHWLLRLLQDCFEPPGDQTLLSRGSCPCPERAAAGTQHHTTKGESPQQ